jgi:hypothetical protein
MRDMVPLRIANSGGGISANAPATPDSWQVDSTIAAISQTDVSIALYPNPTTKVINVEYGNPEITTEEVRILNNSGQVVYKEESLSANFVVPFESLPSGSYYIWLKINGNIERFQVIKE